MKEPEEGEILGFDYGNVRIGVARANLVARFPEPLEAIDAKKGLWKRVDELITEHRPVRLVVGLPRNMKGQETKQSAKAREFAQTLGVKTGLEVIMQDESLTSVEAETALGDARGTYDKAEVDMFAAAAILDDYLGNTVREV